MGDYLAKRLATIAALVDKSMPIVAALFDAIPRGEGGRRRGPGKTLLFDVSYRLAQRVPLTKLVELDGEIGPYLATLMVASLARAGKTLVVPEGICITMMIWEAFNNMLLKEAGHNYNNYGLVSRYVLVLGAEEMPKEVELVYRKHLESKLDQLTSVMTSLTKRLTGKGTGQGMEYKEELVRNMPTAAQNAIVSMAKKVKDNVLCVMTAPVITPPSAVLKTPASNPPSILPRVPNTLVIT